MWHGKPLREEVAQVQELRGAVKGDAPARDPHPRHKGQGLRQLSGAEVAGPVAARTGASHHGRSPPGGGASRTCGCPELDLGPYPVAASILPIHQVGTQERPSALPPDPIPQFAIAGSENYGATTAFVEPIT